MTWLQIVLGALTTYRLAILITRDTFPFGPPREWLTRHYSGSLVELVNCVWCVSMWMGTLCLLMTWYFWNPWWLGFEAILSFSAVAGFLSEHS